MSHWHGCKSCTKKELQSFLGHLSHAAKVVHPGCIFLRNLFSLQSCLSDPCHYAGLNRDARADITWWQCLLRHWNGRSFFPPASPTCRLYSNLSGSYACGVFSTKLASWFQIQCLHYGRAQLSQQKSWFPLYGLQPCGDLIGLATMSAFTVTTMLWLPSFKTGMHSTHF